MGFLCLPPSAIGRKLPVGSTQYNVIQRLVLLRKRTLKFRNLKLGLSGGFALGSSRLAMRRLEFRFRPKADVRIVQFKRHFSVEFVSKYRQLFIVPGRRSGCNIN